MNIFDSVKFSRPPSSNFDLTHDVKMSFDMGELIPACCVECVPGDRFKIGCEALLRLAPLVSPVMHRMDFFMHYFFVPSRILWPNWEKFITNTPLTPGGVLPAFPVIGMQGAGVPFPRLADYMGIPSSSAATYNTAVSALPFAAYQRIYHEYYRDQNLVLEEPIVLKDGDNNDPYYGRLTTLQKRAWEHDYFTSALPFAQKGTQVTLPIGGFKDVAVKVQRPDDGKTESWPVTISGAGGTTNVFVPRDTAQPGSVGIGTSGLFADTSAITQGTTTINDLRRATKLQEWLEKAARGGSRLVENIFAHFGVKSQDARFQRPEYITGTKSPVIVSEVLNTTGTEDVPQGNMAGHGISVNSHHGKGFYCPEHGFIVGIMSVLPRTAYSQGIPKHFLKFTDPFEYYWPSFANIGEQPVLMKELYAYPPTALEQTEVFGYVPRYAEYKYTHSRIAGDFRTTLEFWQMGRKFASKPALNRTFIEMDKAAAQRIFAVQGTEQNLYCHVLHKIHARRLMPKFGTPQF